MAEKEPLKVVPLKPPAPDITTTAVLHHAIGENLKAVIVLGIRHDGAAHIDASSIDGPEAIWLLELAKGKAILAALDKGGK